MYLEIVTPEASLVSGEVESVTVPGVNGEFQMLNNHASIVSSLQNGKVKFRGTPNFQEGFEDNTTTSSKSVVWSWETDRLLNNNIKRAKTFFI
jgi:F-type H+-transporting ATPase subunit epsilon